MAFMFGLSPNHTGIPRPDAYFAPLGAIIPPLGVGRAI
jgi:hypothetical protein